MGLNSSSVTMSQEEKIDLTAKSIFIANKCAKDKNFCMFTDAINGGAQLVRYDGTVGGGGDTEIGWSCDMQMRAVWTANGKAAGGSFSMTGKTRSAPVVVIPGSAQNGVKVTFKNKLFKLTSMNIPDLEAGQLGTQNTDTWDEDDEVKYGCRILLEVGGYPVEALTAEAGLMSIWNLAPKVKLAVTNQKIGAAVNIQSKGAATEISFAEGKNHAVVEIMKNNQIRIVSMERKK